MKIKYINPKKKKDQTMSSVISASYDMNVNGHGCQFNMPPALVSRKDSEGNEVAQGLPPHNRVVAYPVDEFPACPDNWMHGSAKASSYFLKIEEGKGMWLDFNSARNHTHDVAVVVSVQGINSVTGQKTSVMRLEQYKTKCPVHDVEFEQDRFCPKCKYKWPAQNYLATTGTPHGHFWLDGFRNAQGQVRQYVFSEDEAKGVAAKKIGNDRVFAIGIAFYRSKQPKPVDTQIYTRGVTLGGPLKSYGVSGAEGFSGISGPGGSSLKGYYAPSTTTPQFFSPTSTPQNWTNDLPITSNYEPTLDSLVDSEGPALYSSNNIKTLSEAESKAKRPGMYKAGGVTCSKTSAGILKGGQHTNSISRRRGLETKTSSGIVLPDAHVSRSVEKVTPTKNYEVAAGARINQEVYPDTKDLDYWEETPAGFIYINYASVADVEKILASGRREEKEEGFLDDVPVGN